MREPSSSGTACGLVTPCNSRVAFISNARRAEPLPFVAFDNRLVEPRAMRD